MAQGNGKQVKNGQAVRSRDDSKWYWAKPCSRMCIANLCRCSRCGTGGAGWPPTREQIIRWEKKR